MTMDRAERRLAVIWAAMVVITLVSYAAGQSGIHHAVAGIAAVVALALIKVRFVLLDFMDVRHAPLLLRSVLEVWVVGLGLFLIFLAL